MTVKILMNWDIKPGRDQEYFEFVVREWVPGIQRLGLKPTGAWYTVYSREKDSPQIMTEGITEDLDTMRDILASEGWRTLFDKLSEYVANYQQKIVRSSGGFQV
jgi:hypothetical protein